MVDGCPRSDYRVVRGYGKIQSQIVVCTPKSHVIQHILHVPGNVELIISTLVVKYPAKLCGCCQCVFQQSISIATARCGLKQIHSGWRKIIGVCIIVHIEFQGGVVNADIVFTICSAFHQIQ